MKRAGWIVVAVLALASFAFAVQEELLEQSRKLSQEAKPFVVEANDADATMEERRTARREAFKRLKEAVSLFGRYLDANPTMEEKLDAEFCDLHSVFHGIKKDSGLGELEKEAPLPELPGTESAPPKPKDGEPAATAPVTTAPAPSDAAERAKRSFAAIQDFEKKHPADLPTQQRYYEKFLADFPDPSLAEYAQVAQRLGKVTERIRKGFEAVAQRSFDSLSGGDSGEETAILTRLMQDLNSKDVTVRRRAAQLMAATRARPATYFLARGLADKDAELAGICKDGLIAIGGPYSGENLVKLYRDSDVERQRVAMEILNEVTKRSRVDAAAVSQHVGRFALSNEDEISDAAIVLLTRMGKEGSAGLLAALDSKNPDKKVRVIKALADAKVYKSTTKLSERFLTPSDSPAAAKLREASLAAIKQMGIYTIPYLIPMLRSSSGQYTSMAINSVTVEISGDRFGFNDEKKVRKWWNEHKPADAEE